MNQKFFDTKSPGFIYSIVVSLLTLFTASGVVFPKVPADLATEITTTISTGGVYALIGVIAASVIFPVYNAIKSGALSLKGLFSRNLTWIALGNIAASIITLTGFVLPSGTVEQIVAAVSVKDWGGLISVIGLTVVNTLIRFLKQKEAQAASA